MKLPPYLGLRKSDPGYEAAVREYFLGMYQSSWQFLVWAARSNVMHAATETSRLTRQYLTAIERGQRPAETLFLMNLNYSTMLAGPLLGTILTVAAALEAFLRIAMRAFLEKDLPKAKRGGGTSDKVLRKLAEFDDLTALAKLDDLFHTLLARRCPNLLRSEFRYLLDFRNDCFHADPVLRLATGDDETTKRGQRRPVPFSRGLPPEYPLLWASNRPLFLSHALRAIRVHDDIVRGLLEEPTLMYLREAMELGDEKEGSMALIAGGIPKGLSPQALNTAAKEWDEVVERGLAAVPEEDRRRFLLEIRRKVTVHPVK